VTPKGSAASKKDQQAKKRRSGKTIARDIKDGHSARALEFRARYVQAREGALAPEHDRDDQSALLELLDLAVPSFADWCAIDMVRGNGTLERVVERHTRGEQGTESGELDEIARRVSSSGRSEVWHAPPSAEARAVVVGLRVNGAPYAVVTLAVDEGSYAYGPLDVTVAEEVVWGVGDAIERLILHQNARSAVRGTQKIASQLHQLIAVSITVAGLRSESDILTSLAASTRNVFDADVATVLLESGPAVALRGFAERGKPPVCEPVEDSDVERFPVNRSTSSSPWRDGDWLVAPILERRGHSKGVVAVSRRSSTEFLPEDNEVLTLLAQMAATSLGAAELSRDIQRSEARWRILVETAPAAIVEVDLEGRVRWWNRTARRIFAWPAFDPGSSSEPPRFPDSAISEFSSLWREVLEGEAASGRDFIEVEVKGRRKELTTSATLLPSREGEERTILMLVDDVTDQRQLKAEVRHAQQMEMRGQVASTIAHDFNNLLTLISGYAEILSRDLADDDRSLEMVRDIQSTASRASLLTAQLQTIGRTKSLEPVVLDPVAVLQSNAEVLERIVGNDVELKWALNMKSANVRVDAGQFEQMILNLAINARDAMGSGGVLSISVDMETVDDARADLLDLPPGPYVRIRVGDTGAGMEEETRQRCFEPFFTTKGPFKGTGMGLAAARRLVEESGGSIDVESEAGVGTTFEIILPALDDIALEKGPTPETAQPRGSATILLAEDDEQLRRLITQVLGRNGYRVIEAQDGERALQLADEFEGQLDLLVSDVVMPEVAGPELARTLQSANPSLRVLMISGTANSDVLEELLPGTNAFLAKPFRPSELIDRIQEILSRD